MANIQEVAEELCRLTAKEVNELAQVIKSEYGMALMQRHRRKRPAVR